MQVTQYKKNRCNTHYLSYKVFESSLIQILGYSENFDFLNLFISLSTF